MWKSGYFEQRNWRKNYCQGSVLIGDNNICTFKRKNSMHKSVETGQNDNF